MPLNHFRQQYFGPVDHYLGWHEGYEADLTCLNRLSPAQRQQAETELLAALQTGTADPRTLLGLGHLHSRAALLPLHGYLATAAAYALQAIAQIDPAALNQTQLLQQLSSNQTESTLIDLLLGLRTYFTLAQLAAPVTTQVFDLLRHPHYLVRCHALATLRSLHKLPTAALEHSRNLTKIRKDPAFQLISPDGQPTGYQKAQRILQQEIQAATPAPLAP